MPGHRVGVPRWRMRRIVVRGILAAFVAAGFGLFLRTSHTDVARGAAPAVVTLEVWPAGQGRIEATQSGAPVAMTQSGDAVAPPGACDFALNLRPLMEALPCVATVAAGVPVTFMAFPEASVTGPNALPDPLPNSQFKRWTVSGCGPDATCTFTPADGDWVSAIFSPLQLEVGITGTGTVTAHLLGGQPEPPFTCGPPLQGFGDQTCHGAYDADSSVLLEASSNTPVTWGPECDQGAGPSTCTVRMTNLETFASASFNGALPGFPFQISPRVRVVLGGTGHGRVTGEGSQGDTHVSYDCGTACANELAYQDPVRLDAIADPGSRFAGWQGVCSTTPHCEFRAGSATVVEAVFDPSSQPPPAPQPPLPAPPPPPPPPHRIDAHFGKFRMKHRAGHRLLFLPLVVDRAGHATLRLSRRGRTILLRRVTLHAGSNLLQLRLPTSLKRGRCRLNVRIVAGDQVLTLPKSLAIGR